MGKPGLSCCPGYVHRVFVKGWCAVSYFDFKPIVPIAFAVTAFSVSAESPPSRPRRSLGQHFLVNDRILGRIVAAARLSPGDTVVEIGPGRGALTRRLLPAVERLVAVELDGVLAAALPARMGNLPSLAVVNDDARTLDLATVLGPEGAYKVVANLPYYAANPIIRRFLECDRPPELMVVMVQREVAESMAAVPGRMSLLSVATQFYARVEMVCDVSPASFRPPPKVTSAVVRLERLPQPAVNVADAESFFDLARAGFSAPRKQLRNSLSHGLSLETPLVADLLAQAGVDATRRAETLTLEEWGNIYTVWADYRLSSAVAGAAVCG